MSQELAPRQSQSGEIITEGVATWTREQVELFKSTILGKDFTDNEMKLAMNICHRTGLDPFQKQIHFVKRQGKMTPQTSIDGFRSKAEETREYAGNDDYLFDEGLNQFQMIQANRKPITASATVWRLMAGVKSKFTATAAWDAYYPGDAQGFMWKKMPYLMLGKCAEALAFRKAFPSKLGGIYTDDEMHQASHEPAPSDLQRPVRKSQTFVDSGPLIAATPVPTVALDVPEVSAVKMEPGSMQPVPMPPPQLEPAKCAPGEQLWNGYVVKLEVENGTQKKPPHRPYTKYYVIGKDGWKGQTFSKSAMERAKQLAGTGEEVCIKFKTSEYGNDIISVDPAVQPPAEMFNDEPGAQG